MTEGREGIETKLTSSFRLFLPSFLSSLRLLVYQLRRRTRTSHPPSPLCISSLPGCGSRLSSVPLPSISSRSLKLTFFLPSLSLCQLVIILPSTLDSSSEAPSSPSTLTPFVALHAPSAVLPFDPLSPPSVGSLPYPLQLEPLGKLNFYTEQGSFQIFTMLKSPMILMMMASGVMMLGLPWILVSSSSRRFRFRLLS